MISNTTDVRQCLRQTSCSSCSTRIQLYLMRDSKPVTRRARCWLPPMARSPRRIIQITIIIWTVFAGSSVLLLATSSACRSIRSTSNSNYVPSSVTSSSNKMLIVFTSDDSEVFPGFQATYNAVLAGWRVVMNEVNCLQKNSKLNKFNICF